MPIPADPIHPDQLDDPARFRADLFAYLDSLPVGELAELPGELPSRQQPLGWRFNAVLVETTGTYDGGSPSSARSCHRSSPTRVSLYKCGWRIDCSQLRRSPASLVPLHFLSQPPQLPGPVRLSCGSSAQAWVVEDRNQGLPEQYG